MDGKLLRLSVGGFLQPSRSVSSCWPWQPHHIEPAAADDPKGPAGSANQPGRWRESPGPGSEHAETRGFKQVGKLTRHDGIPDPLQDLPSPTLPGPRSSCNVIAEEGSVGDMGLTQGRRKADGNGGSFPPSKARGQYSRVAAYLRASRSRLTLATWRTQTAGAAEAGQGACRSKTAGHHKTLIRIIPLPWTLPASPIRLCSSSPRSCLTFATTPRIADAFLPQF